ncbi:MAG: hypothetical protein ACO3CI_04930 [Schleiferiaceae bacterium]
MNTFWSAGKLLLSGEYWVLYGAEALAVPTVRGQRLTFAEGPEPLHWTARDGAGRAWLDAPAAQLPELQHVLEAARALGGRVAESGRVETDLEFDRAWGWGSSSTLTDLVAQWTGVDPMRLHFATSQGSGFDVACARAHSAILYRKTGAERAEWSPVASKHWPTAHLGLVYLGAKQDSQREVARSRRSPSPHELDEVSGLSRALAAAADVAAWREGILELEARTAAWLEQPRVQERFKDAPATLKSLGAWGGDFALAVAEDPEDLAYFSERGYQTMPWTECVNLP